MIGKQSLIVRGVSVQIGKGLISFVIKQLEKKSCFIPTFSRTSTTADLHFHPNLQAWSCIWLALGITRRGHHISMLLLIACWNNSRPRSSPYKENFYYKSHSPTTLIHKMFPKFKFSTVSKILYTC